MNPQPEFSTSWAVAIAWLFLVYLFFCNKQNHYKFSDKFTIATIEEDQPAVSVQVATQANPIPPVPPAPSAPPPPVAPQKKKQKRNAARKASPVPKPKKPKRNSNGYTELQQDCFEALKSLGMKTVRERKYIVSTVFNNHKPSTVQDFLKLALSRGC